MKTRSAAALAHWILVGVAGLAGTLSFTAVRAARAGCVSSSATDLIAVVGTAGLGLALATLLLVGTVDRYRSAVPALAAISALVLSVYAMVALIASDGATCI